ncbi:MAG TPA: ABC transporter permease [Streptosporangiaceae bacterium]|nr:ABC transporter permease [Streptosporangiaceae bacterium]
MTEVASRSRVSAPRNRARTTSASTLAGTGLLIVLALRRDRVMLVIWIYVFAAFVAASAYGFKKLYPAAPARELFVVASNHNAALLTIYGPFYGSSLGSFTAWRDTTLGALLAAIMTIFIVVRHSRGDEESGRLELVGSAAVGRHAALVAGMLVACIACLAVFAVLAVIPIAFGLPAAGSIAFAAGVALCGLVFAAVAAVTAQLAQTARSARGLAIGVLLVVFLFRAIGDSVSAGGPSWLRWLSPIGWAELTRPFGTIRWWVLALPLAAALLAGIAGAVLTVNRDYDSGLLATRAGRPCAAASLRSPFALALRLQRATVIAWVLGALVYGVGVGSAAKGINGLLGSAQVRRVIARMGGQAGLTNAYLAALVSLTGMAVAGFAISAVLRLRSEETDLRADPVLATRTSRMGWALSHIVIAVAGTLMILTVAGVAIGLGHGARAGSLGSEVARMAGAALAQAPAVLVAAGVAAALFGLAPRITMAASWGVLGVAVLLVFFGDTLQWPQWVLDLSPFTHSPRLPGSAVSATPLVWLCALALALGAAGLIGLRRRDIV